MASYYGYTGPEAPAEYLEKHIFPILLPGMEEMLRTANATEKRRRFNSLDYIATHLYRNNPLHTGREGIVLKDIPFVKEEWVTNPRPPLPLSATLTEEEAATIIQAYFRAYLVRRKPDAQLFRTWQRNVQKEREAAQKIQAFWRSRSEAKKRTKQENIVNEQESKITNETAEVEKESMKNK